MSDILAVVLPVFLVIGAGYGAARVGWISAAAIDGLMAFTQRFAIPCLLFVAISTLDLAAEFSWRLLVSFYAGALAGFAAGTLGARLLFGRPWEDAVAIGFLGLFSNSVLLGLPVSERAFGPEGLAGNYAIIAIHAPVCLGVGITVMEIVRAAARPEGLRPDLPVVVLKAMFSNALILGIVAGMAVNLAGVPVPRVADDAVRLLAAGALPAALFGLGGVLVRYAPTGEMGPVALACAASLALHPALTYGLGLALDVPEAGLRSAVVTAAMAPGVNGYIFADMYGRARRVAASTVLIGTGLTVLTAAGWLAILP